MEMKGYDSDSARAFILGRIDPRQYADIGISMDALVRQSIAADMEYMRSSGVLTEDGLAGDAYYDDDDAFEFLLERVCQERGLEGDIELRIASFLDDYMDAQQAYMEQAGLMDWDG